MILQIVSNLYTTSWLTMIITIITFIIYIVYAIIYKSKLVNLSIF